jgi:membrane-bound lytic murein transglycosylase D
MLRARQEHGNDIARIVKEYDGASFGFASRNYYAEFLAVCDIMADLPRYFPESIDYQPPPSVKRIVLTQEMASGEIAKKYHVHYKKLAELNPSWTKGAAEGQIALPANTVVWLPSVTFNEYKM